MELILDTDVQMVLETMQRNISAEKLVGVADVLPQLARILWGRYASAPVHGCELRSEPICGLQSNAI